MEIKCPSCGSKARKGIMGLSDLVFHPITYNADGIETTIKNDTFTVWRCTNCGSSYSTNDKDEHEIKND